MLYKIIELSTDKASGHTYVLIHFWKTKGSFQSGKPPDRINDFLMQLRPTAERIITNIDGWYKRLSDGVFIDFDTLPDGDATEWEMETVDRDLPAQIKANAEAYWQRAEGGNFPTNHTDARIKRDNSDPHNILARSDVAALRGAEVEL